MLKKYRFLSIIGVSLVALLLSYSCNSGAQKSQDSSTVAAAELSDPLPSWNDGANKKAIIDFVKAVTTEGSQSYVKPEDRIATFDNDGTLWAEQPVVQVMFIFQCIKKMVEKDPSLKVKQPYKAVVENDTEYLNKLGATDLLKLFIVTQTGMTQTEYQKEVADFFASFKTPSGKTMSQLRYQPQLELLDYLRANDFKIFICSGGSVEFMRVISQEYYGIPPERVIGTEFKYTFNDSINDIQRMPEFKTFNDQQEKPVNIQYQIGKRPILACGNEGGMGDIYMLRFSQGNTHPSLQLIINHDDADREFFYQEKDNTSLDWAKKYGWSIISMKNDWKKVFADK